MANISNTSFTLQTIFYFEKSESYDIIKITKAREEKHFNSGAIIFLQSHISKNTVKKHRRNFLKRVKPVFIIIISAVLILAVSAAGCLYFGVIHFNNPSDKQYPVKGADISSYQGEVDFEVLARQNISFVFIKSTEGSTFVDPRFEENWRKAAKTNMRVGAYHFFSFSSEGQTQAELFCKTVKKVENMLPPVIDMKYYGRYKSENNISVADVKKQLRIAVEALTVYYGTKPIIYVMHKSYKSIVGNDFSNCDLWYRSVYSMVPQSVDWTFRQYSNLHTLDGYSGNERYIDMNVFNSALDDFKKYRIY